MTQMEILWNTKLNAQNDLKHYGQIVKRTNNEVNKRQIIITLIYSVGRIHKSHDACCSKQRAAQKSYTTRSALRLTNKLRILLH